MIQENTKSCKKNIESFAETIRYCLGKRIFQKSKAFYKELFGLKVITDFGKIKKQSLEYYISYRMYEK